MSLTRSPLAKSLPIALSTFTICALAADGCSHDSRLLSNKDSRNWTRSALRACEEKMLCSVCVLSVVCVECSVPYSVHVCKYNVSTCLLLLKTT